MTLRSLLINISHTTQNVLNEYKILYCQRVSNEKSEIIRDRTHFGFWSDGGHLKMCRLLFTQLPVSKHSGVFLNTIWCISCSNEAHPSPSQAMIKLWHQCTFLTFVMAAQQQHLQLGWKRTLQFSSVALDENWSQSKHWGSFKGVAIVTVVQSWPRKPESKTRDLSAVRCDPASVTA